MKQSELTTAINGIDGSEFYLNAILYQPTGPSSGLVFFCLPGGSVSRDYFDLGMIDGTDYSFVSWMTSYGHSLITMDHPGTATNPLPDQHPFLQPRHASDYLAEAFGQFLTKAKIQDLKVIGLGHSMGGMTTTLIQARHSLFAGIALLGSSARGLDWGLDDREKEYIGNPIALEKDLEELTLRKFGMEFPMINQGPSGESITFGGATPELNMRLRETTIPLFGAGGMMSMVRGSFALEAAAIETSMFLAFGDHDIGAPPNEVPQDYPNAASLELHIMEKCGHNSLAFPTIAELCSKLDRWARSLSD